MTDDQIKFMVNRFLAWRLPEDFRPDAGISFKAEYNEHTQWPMKHEPVGTNLLSYAQAEAMVRHMLEGLPSDQTSLIATDDACGLTFSPEAKRRALDLIKPDHGAAMELEEVDALRRKHRSGQQ